MLVAFSVVDAEQHWRTTFSTCGPSMLKIEQTDRPVNIAAERRMSLVGAIDAAVAPRHGSFISCAAYTVINETRNQQHT